MPLYAGLFGKKYKGKRLLSYFELKRKLKKEFGKNFYIDIRSSKTIHNTNRFGSGLYKKYSKYLKPLLKIIGPGHEVLSWK